jgi:hypothetical protein
MMHTTTLTSANVSLRLDRTTLARLCQFGFLDARDRDPASVRDAVATTLADRLAPHPEARGNER